MSTLTPEGRDLVRQLARRHDFSEEAVTQMLTAMVAGHARMAQFAHPEFGGSGQWMSGGMLMLGDMFDQALKGRVQGLCTDLSSALGESGPLTEPGQQQSQGSRRQRQGERDARQLPDGPFLTRSSSDSWWPRDLGTPTATGSQNAMRYAYFAQARRLAVESDGEVRVHDTLDHRIGGFSQQQGSGGRVSMSSQHGTLDLASLPLVSHDGEGREKRPHGADASGETSGTDETDETGTGGGAVGTRETTREDPLQLIARLGQLREQGLLTEEEFTSKKQELLSRL